MTFEDLQLAPALLKAVREQGYDVPTPIQAQAIPLILEGRDLLGGAQTGTGKTAAFTLPLLHAESVQQEAGGASSSLTVVLMSQFREYRIAFDSPIVSQQWRKELSDRVDARNLLLAQQPQALPLFPSASFPWRSDTGVRFHSPAAHYFEAEADAMEALEVAALRALGVPNPYDD